MGIDYTFYLRVGFSLDQEDVEKAYSAFHEEKFHYEDHFDPKNGNKLKPMKIFDEVGGFYLLVEYEGEIYEDILELVQETDFFHKKFDCEVSIPFDCRDNANEINFYLETSNPEAIGCGRVNVSNTNIPISRIEDNKEKLFELKAKLEKEFNIYVGEPRIFIESWIG